MGQRKPKEQPTPDPATIASSTSSTAAKQAELANRRKNGFYSKFKNITPTGAPTGGDTKTLG